jgi:hypothetical protein
VTATDVPREQRLQCACAPPSPSGAMVATDVAGQLELAADTAAGGTARSRWQDLHRRVIVPLGGPDAAPGGADGPNGAPFCITDARNRAGLGSQQPLVSRGRCTGAPGVVVVGCRAAAASDDFPSRRLTKRAARVQTLASDWDAARGLRPRHSGCIGTYPRTPWPSSLALRPSVPRPVALARRRSPSFLRFSRANVGGPVTPSKGLNRPHFDLVLPHALPQGRFRRF